MKRGVRELRIVGGSLRSRKWTFADAPGVRPTPDRVRETLFNWLAPHIAGMRVLDLFAGSGALGFEAVSRGAGSATLVESDRTAATNLRATAERFGLSQVRVESTDALTVLRSTAAGSFDLICLDPPFESTLLKSALTLIGQQQLLAEGGFCYIELPAQVPLPPLPEGWLPHRAGKAGEVGYHLLHAPTRALSRNI
ncbi:MAG: 16S rRNA (guanine(966)-N(2))-methyltransferase RsmD [Steroidobacteraceae bacterium]